MKQIYDIVNSVTAQAFGSTALTVVDEQGLVALGNTVLSTNTNTENFLNVLAQRIGKTIIEDRKYESMFKGLVKGKLEWGNVVQKIKFGLMPVEADESYGLTDGSSVDQWKVAKPKAKQSLFTSDTPWQIHVSIQDEHLREAFTSAESMGAFIQGILVSFQNSIETAIENLGRTATCNLIAELMGTSREIKLVTLYNTAKGLTDTNKLTAATARYNEDFLRFAVAEINKISSKFQSMTKGVYNDGTVETHTPKANQSMYVTTDFESLLETQMQYAAFHDGYVKLDKFVEVAFWQSIKAPESINVKKASAGTAVNKTDIVGLLFDDNACGIYQVSNKTVSTPVNAAGLYYNVYHHARDIYWNDLSANAVVFTLA